MAWMNVINKYSDEIDCVNTQHIASIYTEREDVVMRLDNGHRIYTTFDSIVTALVAITEAEGGHV